MAISTNAAVEFFGTEDQVSIASPGAVNNGAFSVAGDVSDWTNDDDAPFARFKFKVLATALSAAPTAGKGIRLYARPMNIESTEDAPVIDSDYKQIFLDYITLDAVDADQVHVSQLVRLPNYQSSQVYEFFIENDSGVNIATGAGAWELWVTPVTFGPHA